LSFQSIRDRIVQRRQVDGDGLGHVPIVRVNSSGFVDCVYSGEEEARVANNLTAIKLRVLLDTGGTHLNEYRFLRMGAVKVF
jgi:hypothetical protein